MLCCISNAPETRRIKIDRYSIGNPINFRHVAHMGSSEVSEDSVCNAFGHLGHQSLPVHLKLIDLPNLSSNNNTPLLSDHEAPPSLCISSTVSPTFTTQSPVLATTSNSTKRISLLDPNSVLPESVKTSHVVMRHSTHLGNLKPESPCLDLSLPLPPPPPPPINPISLRSILHVSSYLKHNFHCRLLKLFVSRYLIKNTRLQMI
ncbi:unnamed protein product [Schistosoma turkestanicum]|nr:unnamed protein product [Schistosoma turkestanicum]